MVEPLTKSASNPNFIGKSYNNHPHWYNEPLRLSKEQKSDPLPVLDDFFECYHLNEARQTLWEWLTEVVSSPRSISSDHHDRSNHVYFYEKLEGVIEAAFVMKKKIHKYRRRWEKRKLKESSRSEKGHDTKTPADIKSHSAPGVASQENGEVFGKPKQLIEYVDEAPLYVINQVFKIDCLANFCDEIREWFDLAMLADSDIYDDADQRRQLNLFHGQLQMLVEALFIIRIQNTKKTDIEEIIRETDKTKLLSQDQIANPLQIVSAFFEKFSGVYITRELNDWLDAGICYSGPRPDNMCEVQVLDIYRIVLCLIKSAERLLSR